MAPSTPPSRRVRDPRLTVLFVATAVAALLALLQRTPYGPLPHAWDGFVTGLAIGFGISAAMGWLGSRA